MEGTSRTLPYFIRFVGLLGSHSLGRNPKFVATAVDLGRELIRRKIKLAYGGGSVGLQGAVASTVFTNGGLVRGFIPGYIATRRVYGPTYGVEHTVSSNYYKYFEMNHAVEAFIVLPGGVDTMEGLFTLISWASKGLHNRPIGLLNIDGYFNNLIKFLDDAVRQKFMSLSQRKLFISSFFVGELLDKLEFAKAFPGPESLTIGVTVLFCIVTMLQSFRWGVTLRHRSRARVPKDHELAVCISPSCVSHTTQIREISTSTGYMYLTKLYGGRGQGDDVSIPVSASQWRGLRFLQILNVVDFDRVKIDFVDLYSERFSIKVTQ
ncbi:hypothetical protein DM860_015289 [Cuscuta australis]|uniref:cytokinin riboside 5'-monophosphate phosphoribohydrolase n=1 Tax=Cuscuta australis TaxID=267555 RepID=A0A328DLC0_9ASTE|nr:hypothetical protein DM860_015289 [Cuscuta australis]